MKSILVPICNRTNYTKLKPILHRLRKPGEVSVDLLVSSGMVVSSRGSGLSDVQSDGFNVACQIDCLMMNDTLESMCKTSGLSMIEHATCYAREKPDAVLIVGDRFDMLPAAISAFQMNIPILHIQGGERSGSVDDGIRDLITITATRHYVATNLAYEHVYQIARNKYVLNVGCPAVEFVQNLPVGDYLDVHSFKKKYTNDFGIAPNENYIAICVHPNTEDDNDVDMAALLGAALSTGLKCVVIYPNIDAFNSKIVKSIRRYEKQITCVKHMPVEDFVKIMAHATVFVGNSSAGIREAASFGTPVVNVGKRQALRERNGNTLDCGPSFEEIKKSIEASIQHGQYDHNNVYYKHDATRNICNDILEFLEFFE